MICKKALGKPTLFKDEMIDASLTVNSLCVKKFQKINYPILMFAERPAGMGCFFNWKFFAYFEKIAVDGVVLI
jgi:hypothetical protein